MLMSAADAGTIRAIQGMLRVIYSAVGAFTTQILFHKIVFFCCIAEIAYTVFKAGIPPGMCAHVLALRADTIII